jgi:hypothetical protein
MGALFVAAQEVSPSLVNEPAKGGTIKAVVKFEGTPPAARPIDMKATEYCHQFHEEPVNSEEVVVNENKTLRWTFVRIKKAPEGTYAPPKEPALLNQEGCTYHPHVLGVMAGQSVTVRNSDDTLHNIHPRPKKNTEWNFSQAKKGQENSKAFEEQEFMVEVTCDVHGWMKAWVGVSKHPFFGVSNEKGEVEIKNVPAGEYDLVAWHEKYGEQTMKVKVEEGKCAEVTFTYKDGNK